MHDSIRGKVIRIHTDDGYKDLGRIIYEFRNSEKILYILFPVAHELSPNTKNWLIKAPRYLLRASIPHLGGGQPVSLVDFVPPPEWLMTDDELNQKNILLGTHRRNLRKWLEQREKQKTLIAPIIENYGEYELLELGLLQGQICKRSEELGIKGLKKVGQAMRRYLLGCGHPNALLPRWSEVGGKGKEKYCAVKTGAPAKKNEEKEQPPEYPLEEGDKERLREGWVKYKKKRVSVRVAYLLTCAEYWPGDMVVKDRLDRRHSLALAHKRPTEAQFRWASRLAGAGATRINLGERIYRLTKRILTGLRSDGVYAVGQIGLIDSTSEDQTLVSVVNPLKILPSTYRTLVIDVKSEYILGMYSGFEFPSTLTSLLAILNSATPKDQFCSRYGIALEPGEWKARLCKRIRADNGELKSEKGISTMTASEVAAEFVRSYAADLKSLVEGVNLSMHRQFDHHVAGSTQGQRKERGDPAREEEGCRTHEKNMPFVIRTILRHNNEEPVHHLLTLEMRADGVLPTRRAIYEWYESKGYVASEPTDLSTLIAHCLPKLKGVIRRDGLHVFDPRDSRRLIPNLIYVSEWLRGSGLCERAGGGSLDCEIQVNPQDLSVGYIHYEGLHEVHRKTSDPLVNELALFEYLQMTDEDKFIVKKMRNDLDSSDAHFHVENRAINKSAKAAKKAAAATSDPEINPSPKGYEKRKNRLEEISLVKLKELGIGEISPSICESDSSSLSGNPDFYQSATVDLMDQLRRRRTA